MGNARDALTKMILFFNVFITTKAFTIYDRGELGPSQDRLDVFKYTLASFQPLSWEHVVIYAELDEMYAARRAELDSYILSLYPNAIVYPYRNKHQREWRCAVDGLSRLSFDGLIWFSCNDDHIFVDYETALFERLHQAALKELECHPHVAIFPFSWAERICYSAPGYIGHEEPKSYPVLGYDDDYFKVEWGHNDSAQVISKEVLRKWWFDFDYGDAFKPRTDTGPAPEPGVSDIRTIMPWRELSLHYDGSSNVGIDQNAYPAHQIPPGFFEGDIKIQFGGRERLPGYVWLNPDIETYRAVSADGVDYRRIIDDLPLFWRSRISEIKICEEQTDEFWIRRRNDAVFKTALQFWPAAKALLLQRLKGVFRSLPSGEIPLSETAENLGRPSYCTIYKSEPRRSKFSYILLERYQLQSAFQTVHSIGENASRGSDAQIICVGVRPCFDRAMFPLTSHFIVLNDPELREIASYHKHAAWNCGAEHADSDILVFSDTLNIFPADFESRVSELLENADALEVGSRYLTFGPYSSTGAAEPSALLVKRAAFSCFSEDPLHRGEYGGLDRCAALLRAHGLRVLNSPSNLFCWRVPGARTKVLEEARPALEVGVPGRARRQTSTLFLEGINRMILSRDLQSALSAARKIPQFAGVAEVIEVLRVIGEPTIAAEQLSQIMAMYSQSGQHLAFAAAMHHLLGDKSRALTLANRALEQNSSLISPQIILLQGQPTNDSATLIRQWLHLIRTSPLEESLWSMMKG